ncbi:MULTISPECIES: CHAP domain-containing protein [unclassified Microcoleus]|uniref:CHAP domain-containing protein n=1 Tax=unclassified Microcoleus TaxID=2642155 RepID=UPI002FD05ADE
MPSPSDFGINLNSSSYTNSTVNPFAAVGNPNGVPASRNWLWCTEFAFGRAVEKGLVNANSGVGAKIRGNAGEWDNQAVTWSKTPSANSFIVWEANTGGAGSVGHVGFVERVNSDGSLTITEANWDTARGSFNSRTIAPGTTKYRDAKFISLAGNTTPPSPPSTSGQVLRGTEGPDRLSAPNTNDTLIGNAGNDTLYGEAGNDYLNGGAGNDYLDGYASFNSPDFDTLEGGAGADTFVLGNSRQGMFYLGNGQATIVDYNFRDDYIQLRGNSSQYRLTRQGNDTLVQTSGGDILAVVKNVTDLSFNVTPSRSDFKFV